MDQPSSAALIVSIVAVVLGALGLVGGIIGYVQGTAALRRATLTRQRASAAEEAALGARAQAEQSARIAQDALDRISRLQVRSLGDVADQPTGPLLLPPRVVLTPVTRPATAPIVVEAAPERTALEPGPTVEPSGATQPSEPVSTDSTEGSEEASPASGPVVQQSPAAEEPRAPRHATGPIPIGTASAVARGPIPAPLDEASESTAESETVTDEAPPAEVESPPLATEPVADDPPARSSTGQVTAAGQEAPPMDWAEVLRTGAIPLPTVSRGTYAAPAKSRKTATGPARFEIRAVGRQSFEVVNVGAEEAQLAAVEGAGEDHHLVRPVQTRPVTVPAGGSLAFSLLRVEGRQVSVEVTWQRDGENQSTELAVP